MNTFDFKDTLYKIFSSDTRSIVVFATGAPGVGKTAIAAQAAKLARKPIVTFALPTCEAVDLRGLPRIVDNQTQWASPMPRDGEGVVLLDELSSAPPDVQVAAHHLVWAEDGSDMSLPLGWHIILTGNRASDKTLYRGISAPLRNRMTIVEVEPDTKLWADWAMNQKIAPEVIGFLRWRPELLISKDIPSEGAFPSPRAWQKVSDVIRLAVSATVERSLVAGTVGEGPTTEFCAYLRTARELPSIHAIVANQKTAEIPSAPSLLYALTTGLAQYTQETETSVMPYVERLPAEFALRYILDVRDHYDIKTDKVFREWVARHKSLFKAEE